MSETGGTTNLTTTARPGHLAAGHGNARSISPRRPCARCSAGRGKIRHPDQPMTSMRLAAYIGGGALLVAWFAAAASAPVQEAPPPRERTTRSHNRLIVDRLGGAGSGAVAARAPGAGARAGSASSQSVQFCCRASRARDAPARQRGGAGPACARAAGGSGVVVDGNRRRDDSGWAPSHRGHRRRRGRALYGDGGESLPTGTRSRRSAPTRSS